MPDPQQAALTAQQVIEMFRGLDLPVCDDAAAIKQKFDAKRPLYIKWLRSPDPPTRKNGEDGTAHGEMMLNRRADLLRVVYEHFVRLADLALKGHIAAGATRFTKAIRDDLVRLAREDCRVDDALAERFVEDYLGIIIDGELIRLVVDFTAATGMGSIAVSWTLPLAACDEVEVTREIDAPAAGKKAPKPDVVYPRQRGTSFTDTTARPGTWYVYRAFSYYQGTRSDYSVGARALCMGEVSLNKIAWEEDSIHLSWESPGEHVRPTVAIFRAIGARPAVRRGSHGPEPADRGTTRVYEGSGTSWKDTNVEEGVTYHYLVVALFGPGLFTDGVGGAVSVPIPPPAVPSVSAVYRSHPAPEASQWRDEVAVQWERARTNVPVKYHVRRRDGDTPPAGPKDGRLVLETDQTQCIDTDVQPGARYSYAVFTLAGDLVSRKSTPSPQVDILREVAGLRATTADATVELHWETPPGVERVVVRRSMDAPADHNAGQPVPVVSAGHAKDEGLKNGHCYHYLVCCVYRPDGVHEVVSKGARVEAVPEQMPEMIPDLRGKAQGREAVLTWTPPAYGHAVLLRSAGPLAQPPGTRLDAHALGRLGEDVAAPAGGAATDTTPDISRPYYTIFTVAGQHAISGPSLPVVVCPDVTDLRATVTKDGVALRWLWPDHCLAVLVARRTGAWPSGPDDPAAVRKQYARTEYHAAGDRFVDSIQGEPGRIYYVVYAQATGAPGIFFSHGEEEGSRAEVQLGQWMTLRYQVEMCRKSPQGGPALHLTWSVEDPLPQFAGFSLMAGDTGPPSTAGASAHAIELFRWQPQFSGVAGAHEAWVSVSPVEARRWRLFYCKAVVSDPEQQRSTLTLHPNTCRVFSVTGEGQDAGRRQQPKYRPGAPRDVICPTCFERFPVGEMRFSEFGDDRVLPGVYTWLDRLLHRPPRPPVGQGGKRLTQRRCPEGHPLPFTAGTQPSMILGLIGAKFSGKSHYIATLVDRLENQAGTDLQAALVPVTQETTDRYPTEFQEPLLRGGLELPVTVGVPPPLIYDMTLDGILWGEQRNRGVTLALYDTAGEELQSLDRVRQMVSYLRVASGIMFLVDPLQVSAVRQQLPPTISLPALDQTAAPEAIISNVLALLRDEHVMDENGLLPIPVAVVLTKCDVLRDAGLIEPERLWNMDRRHVGYFDREAFEDMSGMVGELVQHWCPAAYSIVQRQFARYAFFGASATGCASDPATRRYPFIAPWRVEDPLLWLLAELGVIPIH